MRPLPLFELTEVSIQGLRFEEIPAKILRLTDSIVGIDRDLRPDDLGVLRYKLTQWYDVPADVTIVRLSNQ